MKILYILLITVLVSCSKEDLNSEKSIKYEVTVTRLDGSPVTSANSLWYTFAATASPVINETAINTKNWTAKTKENRIEMKVSPHRVDTMVFITAKVWVDGQLKINESSKANLKDRPVIWVNEPIN